MRRVSFSEFGGPEVLHMTEADEPRADRGQVRIAVRAAGVNPVDWRLREGSWSEGRPVEFPSGTGQDAAGIVDEVGEDVTGVETGDRIFGRGADTYAEYAVLHAWARMPATLTFEEAAEYPSVVETAIRLVAELGLPVGRTLLVSGAAGGVGSAVLQIARDRGLHVIGTAGRRSQDYVRSLGARATTYDDGWVDRVRALGPVDGALDLAGAGVIRELIELTGDPAKVISIADLDAPQFGANFSGTAGSMRAALLEAVPMIADGRLRIPVEKAYPLEAAADAQRDSKAGHTRGRRVVIVR